MKVLVIYNPQAGNGRARRLLPMIRQGLVERGIDADILLTCSEDIGAQRNMLASARRTARNIYSQKAATLSCLPLATPETGAAFGHLPDSPFPELDRQLA